MESAAVSPRRPPASNRTSASNISLDTTPVPPSTAVGMVVPPPSSPSSAVSPETSTNRFGLSLSFIQRRRGNSSARPTSSGGDGSSALLDAGAERSPSPKVEGNRNGYGFPSLRRRLSRSAGTTANVELGVGGNTSSSSNSSVNTTLTSTRRTASHPRTSDLAASVRTHRPHTASGGPTTPLVPPMPSSASYAPLTTTVSLPGSSRLEDTAGAVAAEGPTPTPVEGSPAPTPAAESFEIRLVPHLESNRSLHFDPVDRTLPSFAVVSVGRFTDRTASHPSDPARIAFKSKVVSRGHADIWCDLSGKFFIRDTKSSSGTFLNHIRLSSPGTESKPFPLKDGDILQLGVDYQGGTEEIFKCVKMRIELNRGWQKKKTSFNTNAMKQLRELGASASTDVDGANIVPSSAARAAAANASVTDCCICLYAVTICQALFIAPCSHVTHFKCIRPLLDKTFPGFTCPLCRTYCDLEADVEVEDPWEPDVVEGLPSAALIAEEAEEEDELAESDDFMVTSDVERAAHTDEGASLSVEIPKASSRPSVFRQSSHLGESSIADATPKNTHFLSTLAETTFSRRASLQQQNESLSPAESSAAGAAAMGGTSVGSSSQRVSVHTRSSASDEDGQTDGTDEGAMGAASLSKGKGKAVDKSGAVRRGLSVTESEDDVMAIDTVQR